jgi:hypothetical protein
MQALILSPTGACVHLLCHDGDQRPKSWVLLNFLIHFLSFVEWTGMEDSVERQSPIFRVILISPHESSTRHREKKTRIEINHPVLTSSILLKALHTKHKQMMIQIEEH